MPFDATAWLSNNAAMRLSFACKGLWLDMLCCMWVSIERGVMLKPIGGAYTVDELEALYGSGTKELIESLINAELLSVRNDGALYNADMVKMESIRVKRSEAGKKGGVTMGKRILAKVDALVETPPIETPHTPSPTAETQQGAQADLFPRLILTMIDYFSVVDETFEDSHMWQKARLILLVYYLYQQEIKNRLDYRIGYVKLFAPPEQDIKIIAHDFEVIVEKIRNGKAHELSEGDTLYLGSYISASSLPSSPGAR